jgi:hypothetical protein
MTSMHQRSPAAAPLSFRCAGVTHGRSRRYRIATFLMLTLSCMALLAAAAGCGSDTPDTRPEAVRVAEGALQAALGGDRVEFLGLVAPSFLAQARAEMPDVDDETLGGVLIAGFLEDIPFAGIVEAQYSLSEYPTGGTVVYAWGRFVDAEGNEMVIEEADAVRVPIVYEDGRPYIDLLNL